MNERLTLPLTICAAGLLVASLIGTAQTSLHIEVPVIAARSEDVGTLAAIVTADYESISGAVGIPRQWGRNLSLYDPHARFVAVGMDPKSGKVTTRSFNEQEYVDRSDGRFVEDGYVERELGHD
jgi:hypothetical protein